MKKLTVYLLFPCLVSFLFTGSLSGKIGVGIGTNPSPWNQSPSFRTRGMGTGTMIILGSISGLAILSVYLVQKAKMKKRGILTAEAAKIKVLMHQEASAEYTLIGEVKTKEALSLATAKNELLNQAARKGGTLLVIDFINPVNNVWGTSTSTFSSTYYLGYGRVYRLK